MKFIKLFDEHINYQGYIDSSIVITPNLSYCKQENHVHFNKKDWSKEYLTFKVIESGTITLKASNANIAKTISYSTDNGTTWIELTTSTTAQQLGDTLNIGDKVLVKGTNTYYASNSYYNQFDGTAKVKVYGNIMSLISGDNFANSDTLSAEYTFCNLFYNWTNLISAENLVLPATTLAYKCYQYMFYGCTGLTTAPALPATTLANFCYQYMFYGCTGLTTAPELPATTLTSYCYQNMFNGCTSLTTVPTILPATTLTNSCYQNMFNGCTSLTTAPELPATTLVTYCYDNMFNGCTNLNYIKAMFITMPSSTYTYKWVGGVAASGTFVKNSAAEWNATGATWIPSGWTVETASA